MFRVRKWNAPCIVVMGGLGYNAREGCISIDPPLSRGGFVDQHYRI